MRGGNWSDEGREGTGVMRGGNGSDEGRDGT